MTGPEPRAGMFLTAQWRRLLMVNYEVDPGALRPLVPRGVELDTWDDGRHLVSVVGFRFLDTRLLGVPVPLHRDFDEINLRFYVRRKGPEGWRRGVVFVKEIVPRPALAVVARLAYGENYVARPMRHRADLHDGEPVPGGLVEYSWRDAGTWNQVRATVKGGPQPLVEGSHEQFVTEHYWGYAAQRGGGTLEYRVEHPSWQVWEARDAVLGCDVAHVYGPQFTEALAARPVSTFVANGSAVTVRRPTHL